MIEVRAATTDDDLARVARIVSAVSPDNPTTVEEMRWSDEHYPGGRRFVAWLDGTAVGAGGAGRMYVYPPEFEGLWGNISVLPDHRRKGVGTALLESLSQVARDAGKTILVGRTSESHPEAVEFLEHRGFRETERMKVVKLQLQGIELPPINPPEGVTISSLEDQPELVEGVYEVAREALPDIPGDGPMAPGSLEEFRVRDVDRPTIPPGGFVIAIDDAAGRVVGYANLLLVPGQPGVAWHGMTGVARDWRGRGVASALKRGTIAWAQANGLESLEGANDVDNAPMRAVNKRLGYQPQPDEILVRGPILPARVAEAVSGPGLPPDPAAYDSPRAVQARARGLAAPYIAGGLDPEPEVARREERRYLRLLLVMVVVLVLSGFVLGYIASVLGFAM